MDFADAFAQVKSKLGAKSREAKSAAIVGSEQQVANWRAQMTPEERASLTVERVKGTASQNLLEVEIAKDRAVARLAGSRSPRDRDDHVFAFKDQLYICQLTFIQLLGTFELIRAVIPSGDLAPAIGIIAHTRKPLSGERASGRALLNLLASSYVLGSMPRCVFVMQSASDDVAEDRIVWTCCKNNDGELGDRSAWIRCNGLFDPVSDFDWDAWNNDGQAVKIGVEMIPKIIEENGGAVARDILRDKIEGKGASRRTAYRRIEEAEKLKLIKFHKGKDAYELY
jgi:hypothetical protein